MTNIRMLWHDECTAIDRGRALTTSLLVLALTASAMAYFDARDDLYERMSHKRKFAALTTVVPETAPTHFEGRPA
jgi:hypothetical protein